MNITVHFSAGGQIVRMYSLLKTYAISRLCKHILIENSNKKTQPRAVMLWLFVSVSFFLINNN